MLSGNSNLFIFSKSGEFNDSTQVAQMLKQQQSLGQALQTFSGHLDSSNIAVKGEAFDLLGFMDIMRKCQNFEQRKRSRSIKYVSQFFEDEEEEAAYRNRRFTKYRKARRSRAINDKNGPNLDSLYNSKKDLGNKLDPENSRFTNSMQRIPQDS